MPRHIAASGKQQGQWVNCPAQQKCTLTSPHVDVDELYKVALWKKDETGGKYVPVKNLTLEDYQQYEQISQVDKNIYGEILRERKVESARKQFERGPRVRVATELEMAAIARLHKMAEERTKSQGRKRTGSLEIEEAARARAQKKAEDKVTLKRKIAQQEQELEKLVKARYERTEPLEHEAKVTPTHVTLNNGTVVPRVSYTAAQYTKAVEVSNATAEIAKIWVERPVTEKEIDEYANFVKERKLPASKSLMSEGMRVKNSESGGWRKTQAEEQLLMAEYATRDIKDGYKIGTTRAFHDSEAEKVAQEKATVISQTPETTVKKTAPKEDVVKLPTLNDIRGFFKRKK